MKNNKPTYKEIKDLIYNYKTKYKEGFTEEEEKEFLKKFPKINMGRYNDAMMGNTCMLKGKELITYHCDILTALICGIENRNQYLWEWD